MSTEPTGFLYPFIDAEEDDALGLVAELAVSAQAKMVESRTLRVHTLERCAGEIRRTGEAMAGRFRRGGRLFAFGNGGSATDADALVALCTDPPSGRPLPAMSLVADRAVLTALANDVGFDLVFSRQLIAHARPDDIAVGFSTSGDSVNLITAFAAASTRGLLTVGLCGYDGGAMAASAAVDHCLVVRADSVHRIQEAEDALVLALILTVQRCLDEGREP